MFVIKHDAGKVEELGARLDVSSVQMALGKVHLEMPEFSSMNDPKYWQQPATHVENSLLNSFLIWMKVTTGCHPAHQKNCREGSRAQGRTEAWPECAS